MDDKFWVKATLPNFFAEAFGWRRVLGCIHTTRKSGAIVLAFRRKATSINPGCALFVLLNSTKDLLIRFVYFPIQAHGLPGLPVLFFLALGTFTKFFGLTPLRLVPILYLLCYLRFLLGARSLS